MKCILAYFCKGIHANLKAMSAIGRCMPRRIRDSPHFE